MNMLNAQNSMFLIIDIQEKLVNMIEDTTVKDNSVILAKTADILNIPIFITEQYPKGLGSTIKEIKSILSDPAFFEKTTFSAHKISMLSDMMYRLYRENKKQVVLFGIETHICVLQTAFDLLNDGYDVFVVADACGSRSVLNKDFALKRLSMVGAQIVTTEMVVFELLKGSKHENFREIQSLIK